MPGVYFSGGGVFCSSVIVVGSSTTGTTSLFLAKRKESRREKPIKLKAIIRVVFVRMSALEEPKAVWLAPPIKFMELPPFPD